MKKKLIIGLASLVLVAAMAIGGTLAFMTQKTATMTNTFTAAKGLSGEMREPLWDGYQFGELKADKSQPDGIAAKTGITGDALAALGITKANTMTPGLDIPKNPTLKNTSDVPVFMAIKVTYDTMAKFDTIASFALDSKWVKATAAEYTAADGNSEIYFYKGTAADLEGVLAGATTSSALFDKVTIKTTATTDSLTSNAFKITVIGGAVQTSDIATSVAKTELVNLLK